VYEDLNGKGALATMTELEDPWEFVTGYANKIINDKQIKHYKYKDAKQLLLRIMNVFQPGNSSLKVGPEVACQVSSRCKKHYELLTQLEDEMKPKLDVRSFEHRNVENIEEGQVYINELCTVSAVEPQQDPISLLIKSVQTITIHMRIVSFGLRDIQKNLRMIDISQEDRDFETLFRLIQNKMKHHGPSVIFPEAELSIKNVKNIFSDYFEDISTHYWDDDRKDSIHEMKTDLVDFQKQANKLEATQKSYMAELTQIELKIGESLEKFNAVTKSYQQEAEAIEKVSKEKTLGERILDMWNRITVGLFVQGDIKSETVGKNNKEDPRETREQNQIREAIAIKTKAIIIPSLKIFISSFKQVSDFFQTALEELDMLSSMEEADGKIYFDKMKSRSSEVKEVCSQFMSEMSEARTDLAA
jgi:hypothetical protein